MEFKFNLVRSPVDKRDWDYKKHIVSAIDIPESLDLRDKLPKVRNQGVEGACAAFACATMKEYQERKDVNFLGHFSTRFVYLLRENPSEEGMYLRDVMRILKNYGICPESKLPYDTIVDKTAITKDIYYSALMYNIAGYAQIYSINDLKIALNKNGPCIVALPVYNTDIQFWKKNNENDEIIGGHAVCFCGYDKDKGFLLRNSWGNHYGDNGYTWYPYDDWKHIWEVWSSVDNITNKKCAIYNQDNSCCNIM